MWLTPPLLALAVALFSSNVAGFTVPTAFGCKNSLISDDWRKFVLEYHNNNRKRLSEGKQATMGGLAKAAKKMNELVWDCTIEQHAFDTACSGNVDQNYMDNKETFKTPKSCNSTTKTREILKKWWDQAKAQDLAADQQYKDAIKNFGPMAADEAKGFACTYAACTNSESTLHCVYDKKLTLNQNNVYEVINAPTDTCTCDGNPDKCIAYLCQYDYTAVADIPMRTCTNEDGMSGNLQTIATDMHNYYRRLSATGWAVDKLGGYTPTAKAMPALEYDCTTGADKVAQKTKALVSGCPTSATANLGGYSANYYQVAKYDMTREELLIEAIKSWAEQVSTVGVGRDNIYKDGAGFTQYANMLNDQTGKFACAVEICKNSGTSAVACQYNALPSADDPIYTIGGPCKCTPPKTCSKLGGLCV